MRTLRQYVCNGVRTVFPVSFDLGYLDRSHIYVYVGDDPTEQIDYVWLNDNSIETAVPYPVGDVINIRRVVPREPINDYTNGALLEEVNLDDSFLQYAMILEEIADGFMSGLLTDWFVNGNLNMRQFRIINLGDGINEQDAVNVRQTKRLITEAVGRAYVGEVPPPEVGESFQGRRWYKPSEATTYIYYCDGDSCQWVQEPVQGAPSGGGTVIEAPTSPDLIVTSDSTTNVLVVGDGLPINYGAWPNIWDVPLVPRARDNRGGGMGWYHMLYDFLHRQDPNFVHAIDFGVTHNTHAKIFKNPNKVIERYPGSPASETYTWPYHYPFNDTIVECRGYSSTAVVTLAIPRRVTSKRCRLHVVHRNREPNQYDAPIDGMADMFVFKTTPASPITKVWVPAGVVNSGRDTAPIGNTTATHVIDVASNNIEEDNDILIQLRNFRRADGLGITPDHYVEICISGAQGVGEWSEGSNIANICRYGITSTELRVQLDGDLTQIPEFSVQRDTVFIQVGSEDRIQNIPLATTVDNLTTIINRLRWRYGEGLNIVYVSATPANYSMLGVTPTEDTTTWLTTVRNTVTELGCVYVDAYAALTRLPMSEYLHEGKYIRPNGSTLIFRTIVKQLYSLLDRTYIDNTPYGKTTGIGKGVSKPLPKVGNALYNFIGAGQNVYELFRQSGSDNVVRSIVMGSTPNEVIITTNYHDSELDVRLEAHTVSAAATHPIVQRVIATPVTNAMGNIHTYRMLRATDVGVATNQPLDLTLGDMTNLRYQVSWVKP